MRDACFGSGVAAFFAKTGKAGRVVPEIGRL